MMMPTLYPRCLQEVILDDSPEDDSLAPRENPAAGSAAGDLEPTFTKSRVDELVLVPSPLGADPVPRLL